ncbi:uncharacterized protein UBRO_20678 [Ustilago bromivora]|uniref:Uncharacterized protein n=1 Tax=Ustilago bromivora TaxID=307758 RepID=A0A1K0GRP7_9BASI|nr:uncharacterized protein UBRO_20678 [Ustilago bromivora]
MTVSTLIVRRECQKWWSYKVVRIPELLHFLADTALPWLVSKIHPLKTQLTFGGANFLSFFEYWNTRVFESSEKLKPPNGKFVENDTRADNHIVPNRRAKSGPKSQVLWAPQIYDTSDVAFCGNLA